uniref:DNA mismatch repair protein Mlh1 n=1 Tax=Lygus hesperus TaxID=30085 RepID=A0A0A9Y2S6_LYGHE
MVEEALRDTIAIDAAHRTQLHAFLLKQLRRGGGATCTAHIESLENQHQGQNGVETELGVTDLCCCVLRQQSTFLSRNFTIHVNDDGTALLGVPELVPGHTPSRDKLKHFVARLCLDVAWWGGVGPITASVVAIVADLHSLCSDATEGFVRDTLLPSLRHARFAVPALQPVPAFEVTSCEELYRVFERC